MAAALHPAMPTWLYGAAAQGASRAAGVPPIVRWLEHWHTPLHAACASGSESAAVALLLAGADANARAGPIGWTPLHLAASRGHARVCQLLLRGRLGGSGVYGSLDVFSSPGSLSDEESAKQLAWVPADPFAVNAWGDTALHTAVRGLRCDCVSAIAHGARDQGATLVLRGNRRG